MAFSRSRALLTVAIAIAGLGALGGCSDDDAPESSSPTPSVSPGSGGEDPAPGQGAGGDPEDPVSSGPLPEPADPDAGIPDIGEPGGTLAAEITLEGIVSTADDGGTEITYEIANAGKVAIGFGVCGTLERRDGDDWVAVNTDQACIELLAVLAPGETNQDLTASTASSLSDGEYRIIHEVFAQDSSGRSLTLTEPLDPALAG